MFSLNPKYHINTKQQDVYIASDGYIYILLMSQVMKTYCLLFTHSHIRSQVLNVIPILIFISYKHCRSIITCRVNTSTIFATSIKSPRGSVQRVRPDLESYFFRLPKGDFHATCSYISHRHKQHQVIDTISHVIVGYCVTFYCVNWLGVYLRIF